MTAQFDAYAEFFEVFANRNRMRIIEALRSGPKSVSEILAQTGIEQTCASHCLRRLEERNFVTVHRKGKFRVYELNAKTIEPIIRFMEKEAHKIDWEGRK